MVSRDGCLVSAAVVVQYAAWYGKFDLRTANCVSALAALAALGMLANVVRVDSFSWGIKQRCFATERMVFCVWGITPQQEAFDPRSLFVDTEAIFIDLGRADDVAYLLAERDDLYCTYGAEPVTLYGRERIRAAADDAEIAVSAD